MARRYAEMSQASRPTALERQLNGDVSSGPTPIDALRVARHHFLKPQRVDMGEVADELGISRATLYRWVGNRDQLLGEVMWSMAAMGFETLRRTATGDGVDWFMHIYKGFGDLIVEHEPIRYFVENEPECALRVMASKHTPHQERVIDAYKRALEEAERDHGLVLKLDAETLAFVLVRIGESYLWAELITGQKLDREKAHDVARALLT